MTLGLTANAMAACPTGTTASGMIDGKEACGLKETYKSSRLLLTADKVWLLRGGVFIGGDNKDNSTLTIEPGTKVVGATGAECVRLVKNTVS